jgi:serine/threonine-protein kinase RsbW
MNGITKRYSNLERAIDEVRVLLDRWSDRQGGAGEPVPDPQALRYAQLILHEWLANLLQHARFEERAPDVRIRVRTDGAGLTGWVTDNSTGFDLAERLRQQQSRSPSLPERGMGLRIIRACAADFSYRRGDNGRYRFTFSIPADHDPWLSTLF